MNRPLSRARARHANRAGDESGYVLIYVLALVAVVIGFGAAAISETLASRNISNRDVRARRALQAVEGATQTGLYQQAENRIGNSGSSFDLNGGLLGSAGFLDCVEPQFNASLQITGLIAASTNTAGVCPGGGGTGGGSAVAQSFGNHAYAESEFIPGASTPISGSSEVDLNPKIVSLGWENGTFGGASIVYSREAAILAPILPLPVLGANGNLTVGGVSLSGALLTAVLGRIGSLATTINGDIQSVNNITLPSVDVSVNLTLSNGLLGVVRYGGVLSPSTGIAAARLVHTAPPNREPATIASVKASCPAADATVPRQANCADFAGFYTASSDIVNVPAGQTMTLPGGDYVFCNFTAAGTVNARPTASAPVRILIDSPSSSRCKGNNPTLANNTTFAHNEWSEGNFSALLGVTNSTPTNPSAVQIYVAGDQAASPYDGNTFVEVGTPGLAANGGLLSTNPATQALVIYAPTSEVSMTTANCFSVLLTSVCVPGAFTGNLIGDDVTATALTFTQDLDLGNFALYNGVNVYRIKQYVECSPLPTDALGHTYTTLQANPAIDLNGC